MRDAATVIDEVRRALGAEPRVHASDHPIELALADGVLTMAGELGDVPAKKLALERAAAVPGVAGIVDRLRVAPARPMADADIRDQLCELLAGELAFQECTIRRRDGARAAVVREGRDPAGGVIDVAVSDGVVTLDGDAPSLCHKRLAGVLAWWIPGSRDVVNGLGVEPPEQDADEEITEAVRLVLEKDPFVDAAEVRVTTRRAVVTLRGLAASAAQRDMAERDAWYVFGVDGVENRLRVGAPREETRPLD